MDGLGLNGATLPGCDLLTGIAAAAAAGFTHYEPRIPALEPMHERSAEVRATLKSASLDWLPVNALEGAFVGPVSALKTKAGELFSLAALFEIPKMIVVPGPVTEARDRIAAAALLERLRSMAEGYGITLLYEFIGFGHHAFPSLEEARALAGEAGLRLVLDTFHLAVSDTAPQEIERLRQEEIGLVHLSDALVTCDAITALTDSDRVLPGVGQLALLDLVGAICATGFRGPFSVEVFHPLYGERAPHEVAREAFSRATRLLAAAAVGGEGR
ncbi:MAG: sugar phosphate isomerase/epimerase [Candidatus Bipolaricaulota bacterium]|nr:MAG: sugar phosphate isomerase/epimerase [Candidatus Bipolaricaulota bacterium]